MLANATNKDMWINIPAEATTQYVTNLADLIKYGSDGVNPYTSPQGEPRLPAAESESQGLFRVFQRGVEFRIPAGQRKLHRGAGGSGGRQFAA